MASEIRVNRLSNRSGLSTITFANGGVQFSGITTFANGDFRVGTGATILNPSANEMQFHTGGSNRFTINNSGANLGTGNITAVDATFTGNVSIGKTLTYEDVKNVDSVGVVTARTGVKITGGDLTVGTAITASSVTGNVTQDVGITTFSGTSTWFKGQTANKDMYWSKSSGSLIFKDTAAALFGDSSDLQIHHDGSHSRISAADGGDGRLIISGRDGSANAIGLQLNAEDSKEAIICRVDGSVDLYHNASKKFETTSTGIKVSGTRLDQYASGEVQLLIGSSNAGGAALYFDGDSNGDFVGSDYSWIRHTTAGNMEYNADNPGGATHHIFQTGGTERLHIKSDGKVIIGNTSGSDPSATVGGAMFYGGSYPGEFKISAGSGASGTDPGAMTIMGSNHNASLTHGSNYGAQLSLVNFNTNDGNSTAVSFLNSNQLAIARVLGNNASHSGRTGNLVFMTSNGTHPIEQARITPAGTLKFTGQNTALETAGITHHTNNNLYIRGGTVGLVLGNHDNTNTIHISNSNYIKFETTDGSERMRIDSNGSLLIGNSAATFSSPVPSLNIEKTSTSTGPLVFLYNHQSANTASTCEIRAGQNYREANRIVFGRENNSNWQASAGSVGSYTGFYTNSAGTLNEKLRIHSTGQVEFKNGSFSNNVDCVMANSGTMEIGAQSTMKFRTATNERLRINSNGQVTIGTNYGQTSRLLYVETTHSSGGEVAYFGNSNSGNYGGLVISAGEIDRECRFESAWGDSFFTFWTQDSGGAGERMRITKSGDVFFGNTGSVNPGLSYQNQGTMIRTSAGDYICVSRGQNCPLFLNRDDSTGTLISLRYNGTERGTIQTDGTNVAYNTSSDYRLKENVISLTGAIDRLKTLSPKRFNFKEIPSKTVDGFLAHEVTPAVPEAVSGEKDGEEMQQLDYSKLVTLTIAALQEAIVEIETLKEEVAALKSS